LDVDDIVQETYAKLAGLDSVEQIREPKRYMFQTAFSIIALHLRRLRVVSISTAADLDRFDIASPDVSAEQDLIFRDELKELAEALVSLPVLCREAFMLRRVTGLSQKETAERIGVSEKTVEKYMSKSIRFLMDRYGRGGKTALRASKASRQRPQSDDDQTVEPKG
jgi:RNA polymerase sigma-70 factor (ECF subfamily)